MGIRKWSLFEVAGIELEYMIARRDTLDVAAVCDQLMKHASGGDKVVDELDFGEIGWSNELVNHVLEFKTSRPAPMHALESYAGRFQQQVIAANHQLAAFNSMLLPGAMHPWMDPMKETILWPEAYNEIYEAYNRIFDCRGHGWANLQSMHINLPFRDDAEFGKLMAAIRYLMPIMPMLTASSPVADARLTGFADYRLHVYRSNAKRVPSVSGNVVPEPVFDIKGYENDVLKPIYKDIAPYDPEGILQYEWLNSRGAIARFDRSAIEIRILDVQECPAADIAVAALICDVLQLLVTETWKDLSYLKAFEGEKLQTIYNESVCTGSESCITDKEYLAGLGFTKKRATAKELWAYLYSTTGLRLPAAEYILDNGSLSQRITQKLGKDPSKEDLHAVWQTLGTCLDKGRQFI
ncbi:MAG: hypothetical protein LAT67_00850 [Balneolales bacterium]|nr:hypothetical protein [Balneolales bacterium]